ncbi:MAG: diguanylate cyclase domain-containing protein [Faecousia sp.]
MAISDLDITQISIELVGGSVCAMLAIIIMINRHRSSSMKLILKLFFITAALFFADALTYLYEGNTQRIGLFMARFSNLAVFFLNYFLAYISILYVYSILQENKAKPNKIYQKIVLGLFCTAVAILVVNMFTGWMYTFDEDNLYHRNWAWYLYTALSLVCLIVSCVLILKHRRFLDRFTLFCLMLFELSPIVAIVFQSIFYGITITNIGIGVSIILILVAYLINWSRSDSSERFNIEQIRRSYDTTVLFIIMLISVSASMVSCIISIRQISSEISVSSSHVIAHIVNDHIENMFLRPITVTETMSKDYSLQNDMQRSNEGDEAVTEQISAHLESIRSGFNYQRVYVVCEQSRAYYTYNGFVKIIDPEQDAADFWYRDFVASGQRYALKVDTDEANNWDLSVFVNNTVLDSEGNLLGVCGVGLEMSELQRQLTEFEEKYDINITLVNRSGQILIDTETAQIGKQLFPAEYLENANAEEFFSEDLNGSTRLTKWMEDLDWYLVIEDLSPKRINLSKIIVPNVAISMAGLFILAVAFFVITIRERKISGELLEKRKTSLSDELTGLRNRRALQEDCKQIEQSGTLHRLTVILMDLNGLKAANDTLGHQAGDELIVGTAQCLIQSMQDYGQLYRTGGDEFLAILDCTAEELEKVLSKFDRLAASWKGSRVGPISTARGVVRCADYPHLNFVAITDMADRRMYENKKQYYLDTGRGRGK